MRENDGHFLWLAGLFSDDSLKVVIDIPAGDFAVDSQRARLFINIVMEWGLKVEGTW
jgi:hypothetical protein